MGDRAGQAGRWRSLVWGVAALIVLAAGLWLFAEFRPGGDGPSPAERYAEIADRAGLQADPDILDADEDWRARADIQADSGAFRWWEWVRWDYVVWGLVWSIAAGALGFIIYLVWRYGAVIQVGLQGEADEGRTRSADPAAGAALSAEPKAQSLDDILAMDDPARALGALQRLVLEAALSAMNASLRPSDTARAVMRRLPRDWPHYAPVAALVRLAERVRFAGDPFDRDGLAAAIDTVQPVLAPARGGR